MPHITVRFLQDTNNRLHFIVSNSENGKESFVPNDDEEESLWTEVQALIKSTKARAVKYTRLRVIANMGLVCFCNPEEWKYMMTAGTAISAGVIKKPYKVYKDDN